MTEAKRKDLKKKVAAAQERNEERARPSLADRAGESAIEAKDKFTAFAREHPVLTVAGGLAVGVLIAAMFKGPRQAAVKGGTKAAGLAALGADLALAYAAKAYGSAREAGEESVDWVSRNARSLGHEAADYADSARRSALDTGRSVRKAMRGRLN